MFFHGPFWQKPYLTLTGFPKKVVPFCNFSSFFFKTIIQEGVIRLLMNFLDQLSKIDKQLTLCNISFGKKQNKKRKKGLVCQSVKSVKSVKSLKSVKSMKSVKSVKSMKSIKSVKSVKTVKSEICEICEILSFCLSVCQLASQIVTISSS